MRIDSSNYLSMLEALRANSTTQTTSTESDASTQSLLDAYIPSNSEDEILYANYNDILSTMAPPPPMPPTPPTEQDSTSTDDSTTSAVSDSVRSIVSSLSESLRANEDTILSTLESLGLTPEDLLDSENIELVANALNDGAKELGLPTVDDLDTIISNLKSSVESTLDSLESEYSLTEEELKALIEEIKARMSEHKTFDDSTLSTLFSGIQTAEQEV